MSESVWWFLYYAIGIGLWGSIIGLVILAIWVVFIKDKGSVSDGK